MCVCVCVYLCVCVCVCVCAFVCVCVCVVHLFYVYVLCCRMRCAIEGCTSLARRKNGKCTRHGGNTCRISMCNKGARKNGMCRQHNLQVKYMHKYCMLISINLHTHTHVNRIKWFLIYQELWNSKKKSFSISDKKYMS